MPRGERFRHQSILGASALFDVLDGREVTTPFDIWRIEAFSVGDDDQGGRWIQMGLHGRETIMLTLRVLRSQSAWQVLTAVTRWLSTNPTRTIHQILDVA